jgi:hypothetical protein
MGIHNGLWLVLLLHGQAADLFFAQTPSAAVQKLSVVAIVGCVGQVGDHWLLTNATGPVVHAAADGTMLLGGVMTVEEARQQPLGRNRYTMIGLLDSFGIFSDNGHKVLVKGLLTGAPPERFINVTSIRVMSATCR